MNLLKSILAVVFIVIFVLTAYVLTMYFLEDYTPQEKFTTEEWIANEQKRYAMVDNLCERKLLDGKSKLETFTILGKPDNGIDNDSWEYDLRLNHFILGDRSRFIEIFFENDTVETYWYSYDEPPYHQLKRDIAEHWKKE